MSEKLMALSALSLSEEIRSGQTDAVSAARASLEAIREKEESLHAFLTVLPEDMIVKNAEKVQKRIEAGELTGLLAGVPFAVKDNLCTAGIRTTCGSRMLEGYVPSYTAFAVQKLVDAGAILMGKTNMDEFAMGSTTETSFFYPTKNPFDGERSPGGSSGGSAASVAAGEVSFALGSDTGGSVRNPASHCGIFGMKPGYGFVSRRGLIAYASSLDTVGILAKDAADAKAVLSLIAGKDAQDSTSVDPAAFAGSDHKETGSLRIGIPSKEVLSDINPSIHRMLLETADRFQKAGASVASFLGPDGDDEIASYYIIATAEASSNLERYDGIKYGFRAEEETGLDDLYRRSRGEGFGPEVRRRILMGTFVLSREHFDQYYRRAQRLRNRIREEYNRLFAEFDYLLTPVTPSGPPLLGSFAKDPVKLYEEDVFTVGPSLCGLPALSFPAGLMESGLPAGLQLIGPYGSDFRLLEDLWNLKT